MSVVRVWGVTVRHELVALPVSVRGVRMRAMSVVLWLGGIGVTAHQAQQAGALYPD